MPVPRNQRKRKGVEINLPVEILEALDQKARDLGLCRSRTVEYLVGLALEVR